MLSAATKRFITRVDKAVVKNIQGTEWFCVSKSGRSVVMDLAGKSAPTPSDFALMAFGACSSDDVNIILEEKGKRVKNVQCEIDAVVEEKPLPHHSDIRIKFTVDSPDPLNPKELHEMNDMIIHEMCPVANTLTGKPNIVLSASIKH